MENASRAFLDAVRKSMRQIRSAIGATTINPELLTSAERLQYEGYLRREETNAAILALSFRVIGGERKAERKHRSFSSFVDYGQNKARPGGGNQDGPT